MWWNNNEWIWNVDAFDFSYDYYNWNGAWNWNFNWYSNGVCQDVTETCGDSCSYYAFTCSSGQCIKYWDYCDGTAQCDDGSDEVSCFPCSTLTTDFECNVFSPRCSWDSDAKTCSGGGETSGVTLSFVIAGNIDDFDRNDFKANLAVSLGIALARITILSVTAGSVNVEVLVTTEAGQSVSELTAALTP
jgi:hypothetical protein